MSVGTNKAKVAQQWSKHCKLSKRGLVRQYDNTRVCQEFYNGDFMSYQDRIQFLDTMGRRKRVQVQFNKIKPNVDAVAGFMMQNRRQAKYVARLQDNVKQNLYSRYMNSLSSYCRDNANADPKESEQDNDMLICGYGAVETDISYIEGNATTDPNGEILMERLDPMCVGWDPRAKGKNLADGRWAYYWDEYDIEEALSLFDDSDEEDFEFRGDRNDDGGYEYYPYGGRYDKIRMDESVEWASQSERLVRVYNYQWFEYETFYRAKNPIYLINNQTAVQLIFAQLQAIAEEYNNKPGYEYGDMFDFDPRAEELTFDETIKNKLKTILGKYIEPVAFKRKAFYTAVISGKHVFKVYRSICQQGFSIKFKTGTYNARERIWVGMVNSMMDPVKYYNKALTELMFVIAANSKGGVMVEEDAVEDIADFEAKWARTDAVIKVNPGTLAAGKIQEKARAAVPTGLENIITLSDAAIGDTSGIDRSFLGSKEDASETSVLYKRRIRQIISTMAGYMDSITLYAKEHARLMLDFIRIYSENNDGALFRIVGENGQLEFAMIASDKVAAEYDVVVQEAPQSPEDKQETAILLNNLGDTFMAAQDFNTAKSIYAESVKFLNLEGDVQQKLMQVLQPQDKPIDPSYVQQLEQTIQQLMSESNQAEVAKKQADARYSEARAQQTIANIEAIRAKVPQTNAQTIKTLEEAKRTAIEVDMASDASNVNLNI